MGKDSGGNNDYSVDDGVSNSRSWRTSISETSCRMLLRTFLMYVRSTCSGTQSSSTVSESSSSWHSSASRWRVFRNGSKLCRCAPCKINAFVVTYLGQLDMKAVGVSYLGQLYMKTIDFCDRCIASSACGQGDYVSTTILHALDTIRPQACLWQ